MIDKKNLFHLAVFMVEAPRKTGIKAEAEQ